MDTTRRKFRHTRIRARIQGTAERPRASVFRSTQHVTVQLIDDIAGQTLVAINDAGKGDKTSRAHAAGKKIAKAAAEKGIKAVVFDRGGYKYHGRIKAIAEGMREGGLEF